MNGFSFNIWQDKENKKKEEDDGEVRPGINSYLYVYVHDDKNQQFTYIHFNKINETKEEKKEPNFRFRNC